MDPEPNPTICIGHGMGAHVCGMAGMTAKSRNKPTSENNAMPFNSATSELEEIDSSIGLFDEHVRPIKLF